MPDATEQEFREEDYQWFPFYFPLGPATFLGSNGEPSGAAGSEARFTKSISNFPFIFHGVRIDHVYPIAPTWGPDDISLYRVCKEFVDFEQSLKIELTQQNILAEATLQSLVTGRRGDYWSPFPCPFPMAGANNITIQMRRLTSYPAIGTNPVVEIIPQIRLAIVGCVGRDKKQTTPPHRVGA